MNKIKLAFLLLLVSVISINAQDVDKQLLGKWDWVETSGGFGGLTTTPKTEGYQNAYFFSDAKSLYEYRNGKCHKQYTYTLRKTFTEGQEEPTLELRLNNKETKEGTKYNLKFEGKDDLYLSETHPDGFVFHYSRKK
ncbi:MAG: hypothetical protein AB7O73_02365 [Bacteroidia bacterium]